MKVILLCAGYATRLYPLTENQPKPLLPIGGRPILEWICDKIKPIAEVDQVFVVTNNKFAGHFEVWAQKVNYPWKIQTVNDRTTSNDNRLGAIGDLNYVLSTQNIGAEDMLVVAGDNFFDFDLVQFIQNAQKQRPHGSIAVYDVKDRELAKQYGLVNINESGQITDFLEKPENPPVTMASCGLYWLPREARVLLDRYLASGNNPDQPGHYMSWLARQDKLFAIPLEGKWLDIGDRQSYDQADRMIGQS